MKDPKDSQPEGFRGLVTTDLPIDLAKNLGDPGEDFRVLVDLLPICFLAIRGDLILYANPGLLRLLGYEKLEELAGQPYLSLVAPEEHERIKDRALNLTLLGNRSNPVIQLSMIRKTGERILAEGGSTAFVHRGVPTILITLRASLSREKNRGSPPTFGKKSQIHHSTNTRGHHH